MANESNNTVSNDFARKNKNLFFSGVLVLTVSNILIKVLGLLLKIPLTNMIGEEGMGYFNLAYSVYKWFYMVSTAGLPVAVSIMVSESRLRNRRLEVRQIYKVTMILFVIVGIIGSCAMFFGAGLFAKAQDVPKGRYCIMAIAPTLFFICISSAIRGYFQGFQNMVPTAISQIIEAAGKLTLGLLFGYYALHVANNGEGYPIEYVAAFTIAGLTVGVLFGMVFLLVSKFIFRPIFNSAVEEDFEVRSTKTIAKILVITAIPITISSSVMSLTDLFDSMIVIRQLKSIGFSDKVATELYGNYTSLAVPMFNMPPALIYPISYSIVPLLSGEIAAHGQTRVRQIINSAMKIALVIALPCALGMSVLSKPILSLLFHDEGMVDRGAPLLSILALAVIFIGIIAISNAVLQAHKLERKPIISMIAGSVVKLVTSWILVGTEGVGIYGTPISSVLCYLTIALVNLYFILRYVKVSLSFGSVILRPFLSAVLCALTALGIYRLTLPLGHPKVFCLVSIFAAIIVYVISLLILRAIREEDVLLLPKGEKIAAFMKRKKLL